MNEQMQDGGLGATISVRNEKGLFLVYTLSIRFRLTAGIEHALTKWKRNKKKRKKYINRKTTIRCSSMFS